MANPERQQNFANHTRMDPAIHFFALPVFAVSVIVTLVRAVRYPTMFNIWTVVVAAAAVAVVYRVRTYSLKVQDRVIRLEERLRLTSLADEWLRPRIPELTESQLIALRFASDGEAPMLAGRAVTENLSAKQIKQSIRIWRPDYRRV